MVNSTMETQTRSRCGVSAPARRASGHRRCASGSQRGCHGSPVGLTEVSGEAVQELPAPPALPSAAGAGTLRSAVGQGTAGATCPPRCQTRDVGKDSGCHW